MPLIQRSEASLLPIWEIEKYDRVRRSITGYFIIRAQSINQSTEHIL